jgi:hypothetical protein
MNIRLDLARDEAQALRDKLAQGLSFEELSTDQMLGYLAAVRKLESALSAQIPGEEEGGRAA